VRNFQTVCYRYSKDLLIYLKASLTIENP